MRSDKIGRTGIRIIVAVALAFAAFHAAIFLGLPRELAMFWAGYALGSVLNKGHRA